ncbi:site-2 protease family protein [Candidatus Woesearchaeota archaeon]|nr:site-2 protease family protein [Candidatus Woesearchaeota archaeon]
MRGMFKAKEGMLKAGEGLFKGGSQYSIGGITTSDAEIRDILKAWFAISLAFAILLSGSLFSEKFIGAFALAGITVGIGFILHELAHKIVAQHYGCFAEFRAFTAMLFLAVLMSFFGFLFAAPGAVMIQGPVGKRRNGIISAAGPLTNIALSIIFGVIAIFYSGGAWYPVAKYGFIINAWLALFNMVPIWQFDGKKVLQWSRFAFGAILGAGIALQFVGRVI